MKREIFDKYAIAIADRFHLTLDEMFTKTKKREVVEARQIYGRQRIVCCTFYYYTWV